MVRPVRAASRRIAATAVAVALLAVTSCSGDDGEGDADGPSAPAPTASTPPPLATTATIGLISGKLDPTKRTRLKQQVTEVVDDWLDAAYVGGDYPRSNFADAYPHFSAGAARDARRDARLMSNATLGDRIETVEATQRRLRIDVLAVQRKAVGVTARFALTMDLAGEVNRSERVSGSLFLTFREGSWQVFGYDVQRGKA